MERTAESDKLKQNAEKIIKNSLGDVLVFSSVQGKSKLFNTKMINAARRIGNK